MSNPQCTYCHQERKLNHEGLCNSCAYNLAKLYQNRSEMEEIYSQSLKSYDTQFKMAVIRARVEYKNGLIDDNGYIKPLFYVVTQMFLDGVYNYHTKPVLIQDIVNWKDLGSEAIEKLDLRVGNTLVFSNTVVYETLEEPTHFAFTVYHNPYEIRRTVEIPIKLLNLLKATPQAGYSPYA